MSVPLIQRVISAGQNSADRAALDWASEMGIPYGGWCPKGRLAEDGSIQAAYALSETPSRIPLQCNEWNVWEADGVAVVSTKGQLSNYCQNALNSAKRHKRPSLHVQTGCRAAVMQLREFVEKNHIDGLNIVCSQSADEEEIVWLLPRILTDALSRPFAPCCGEYRQSGAPAVPNPSQHAATEVIVPDKIAAERANSPFSESQFLAIYRSLEGNEEYAAKICPMVRNPNIPEDTDEFYFASALESMTQSNPTEAARQLEQISEGMREHPVIVFLLFYAYMGAGAWPKLLKIGQKYSRWRPEHYMGWVFWAIALEKMGQTKDAYALLLSVSEQFRNIFTVAYNLACFACRLGREEDAWIWVQKAFRLTTIETFKLWLLSDEDLKPLREKILELSQTHLI